MRVQEKIAEKVQKSQQLQKEGKNLLEQAQQTVGQAVEQGLPKLS